jgi:hypothetical protein
MLVLKRKQFVYDETIRLTDDKTGDIIYELQIQITPDEAQELRTYLRGKAEDSKLDMLYDKVEEDKIHKLIYKDNLEDAIAKMGEYYTEEYGYMIFAGVVGKLAAESAKRAVSATTKYQKDMPNFTK